MSLEKAPPSRYRIEEKDGQLIVHDSMATVQASSAAPVAQPRSALDAAIHTLPVSPSLSSLASGTGSIDSGKAKRGGTVAAFALILALFLFITNLWPMAVVALLITPMRKRLLGSVIPAVKRYIDEGRMSWFG